jgi:ABC-type glutathione transport system ATPase component
MEEEILRVNGLCKSFVLEKSLTGKIRQMIKKEKPDEVKALDDVSFSVKKGEILGILGESGSGKSTLARVLMGIHKADAGTATLLGRDLLSNDRAVRLQNLRDMQMVFQDPFGSLDPRMTVREILLEPLKIHSKPINGDTESFLIQALEEVGLTQDCLDKYPSQFSGGQRQRIGICRALILDPKIIIADEAVSALDVSVQAQILELLMKLKKNRGLSMIFISHDVAVVRQIADRIIILYHGKIVEEVEADSLLNGVKHEYSKKLLNAALSLREGE